MPRQDTYEKKSELEVRTCICPIKMVGGFFAE